MAEDPKTPKIPPQSLSPSNFSHIITKIAVAQICQSIGFKGSQSSALDTLTRIAILYLQSIAKSAATSAAVCGGRTQCNIFDVVHALEHLRIPSGFAGASDVTRPLLSSSVLKEVRVFVDAIDEVPFARRVYYPERNSGSVVNLGISSSDSLKRGAEVPRWLPEFPGFEDEAIRVSKRRELCWEERMCECVPPVVTEERKGCGGGGKFMVQGRREKVKFRVGVRNVRMGVDGLELRNGVCRGGKRVCLIERANAKANTHVKEDEDEGLILVKNSQNCSELSL